MTKKTLGNIDAVLANGDTPTPASHNSKPQNLSAILKVLSGGLGLPDTTIDAETTAEQIGELTTQRKDNLTNEIVQLAVEILGAPPPPFEVVVESARSWNGLVMACPELANDEPAFRIHQGAFIGGAMSAFQWLAKNPDSDKEAGPVSFN